MKPKKKIPASISTVIISLLLISLCDSSQSKFYSKPLYYFISVDDNGIIEIYCRNATSVCVIDIEYDENHLELNEIGHESFKSENVWHFNLTSISPSSGNIKFIKTNPANTNRNETIKFRYDFYRWYSLIALSGTVRWLCTILWPVSLIFQIHLNWKRRSVTGLDFNFMVFYSLERVYGVLYSWGLYFSEPIQIKILTRVDIGGAWIYISDIACETVSFFLLTIIVVQCLLYNRGNQTIFLGTGIILFLSVTGTVISFSKQSLYVCMKLTLCFGLTFKIIKYIPQIILVHKRRSVKGWCKALVISDTVANIFLSFLLIMESYNFNEWGKFQGLSFAACVTSLFFMSISLIQFNIYPAEWNWSIKRSGSSQTLESIVTTSSST